MGCRKVGFWCGGAFCTVEFHLSLGHQKVAFGAAVLAGLGSFLGGVWLFRMGCRSHLLRRGRFLVWRCVLHGRVSSFFRPSESGVREFFGAAVLAGLGSFLGGVWLFRMGCREVGFWCGGAFGTVEFHLSLGHQKVALESFLGAAVLAGLGSFLGGVWLFRMGCRSHLLRRGRFLVWRCVLHGRVSSFCRPSESGVREFFGAAVLAGLGSFLGGAWLFRMGCREVGFWCGGAFCTVEFHLSLGHQKVALESFLALRFWLVWARF